MKYNLSVKRPSNKYREIDDYIKDGNKIFIKDIFKFGFSCPMKSLHSACLRLNVNLKKVNDNYYIKQDGDYLPNNYVHTFRRVKNW